MKRICIAAAIVVCACCEFNAYGQLHDSLFTFARRLAAQGNYRFAVHEMKRFLSVDSIHRVKAHYWMGRWYTRLGKLRNAADHYEEALSMANGNTSAQLRARVHTALVRNCIQRREFRLARFELSAMETNAVPDAYRDTLAHIRIYMYAYRYETDSARVLIARLDSVKGINRRIEMLDSLLDWYDAQDFVHPRLAHALSGRIPGAGQALSKDWYHAIGGFLLNTALTSIEVWNGYRLVTANTRRQRYIAGMDFTVWGVAVWRRYFSGNQKVAYEAAVRYNRNIQLEYRQMLDTFFAF